MRALALIREVEAEPVEFVGGVYVVELYRRLSDVLWIEYGVRIGLVHYGVTCRVATAAVRCDTTRGCPASAAAVPIHRLVEVMAGPIGCTSLPAAVVAALAAITGRERFVERRPPAALVANYGRLVYMRGPPDDVYTIALRL